MMRVFPLLRGVSPSNTSSRYIDHAFDEFRRRMYGEDTISGDDLTIPSANIQEMDNGGGKEKGFQIELAAAGFERDDFNIEVDNQILLVSASRDAKVKDMNGPRYYRQEHNYHSFSRSFQLPDQADEDNITAVYRNGLLLVFIPVKNAEEKPAPPRRILVDS